VDAGRLRASGVRPINNIVDITNYVMLEYGQPMHAFDYRYVKGGKIIVRRAAEARSSHAGRQCPEADDNMLVIADDTRAVGLAGIMGGQNSEIVPDTVDVVFESANFNGTSIRRTALPWYAHRGQRQVREGAGYPETLSRSGPGLRAGGDALRRRSAAGDHRYPRRAARYHLSGPAARKDQRASGR
jgi:hypothetical protein